MFVAPDILTMAYRQPVLQDDLHLLAEKERQIPGSVQYAVRRYSKDPQRTVDDMGMMVYHVRKDDPAQNYLELRYCVGQSTTVDVLQFRFQSVHLSQFIRPRKPDHAVSEDLLNFHHPSSFSKTLSLCGRIRLVLEALLNHTYTDSLENIFVNAQSQI